MALILDVGEMKPTMSINAQWQSEVVDVRNQLGIEARPKQHVSGRGLELTHRGELASSVSSLQVAC